MVSSNTNTEISLKTFLEKFESLLDTYAPLKKICKNKLKCKNKPWITPGLQKSISIKSQFLSKFIKLNEPRKGSPHKIQAIQKSFIDTIKKRK